MPSKEVEVKVEVEVGPAAVLLGLMRSRVASRAQPANTACPRVGV